LAEPLYSRSQFMTIIHIFTEELSLKKVLDNILPKILPSETHFRIYPHQGKEDLQRALTTTLPSISIIPGSKILITRDQDNNDCVVLKKQIYDLVNGNCACDFSIRIICKELEAWFLGDMEAIEKAYPRFKLGHYINKAEYRNVDRIHYANKQLLRIIPEFSGRESLPKLEVSENISQYMEIEKNKSISFIHTIKAIQKFAK